MLPTLLSTLAVAGAALAAPAPIDPAPAINVTDVTVLRFAQTLEFLEAAFYKHALDTFSEKDFVKANYLANDRKQVQVIAKDEQTHVDFLTNALGNQTFQPCEYDFSAVKDVPSFFATAQVLEGVGTSAYLGAAKLITEKAYLQAAGSILTVEARHSTFINYALQSNLPAIPAAFDTPLGVKPVYSLAAPFFKSCPKDSDLGLKAFPEATLNAVNGVIKPNAKLAVTFDKSLTKTQAGDKVKKHYAAVINGPTSPQFVELDPSNGAFTLPKSVTGTFYVVVTADDKSVTDDNVVAGPVVGFSKVQLK